MSWKKYTKRVSSVTIVSKFHNLWCSTEKDCWQQQHHVSFWPIKVVGAGGNQDRHLPPLTDFLPQGLGAGGQTPSLAGVSLPSAWNPKLLGMTVWLFSVPQSHSTPTQSCWCSLPSGGLACFFFGLVIGKAPVIWTKMRSLNHQLLFTWLGALAKFSINLQLCDR